VLSRRVPWRTVLGWSGLLAAAAVVVVTGIYVVFWPVSDLIARHDVGSITGAPRAAALRMARDAARGRLVAFGAGLFAVGALIYTARNYSLSRQGQVTDRYTKAIEQLGSDKGLDVRIGGIYALERIARDSPRDHPTIMEVLAAFIREHSREQWPPAKAEAEPPPRVVRPDVQAGVTVIGRRIIRYDSQLINLEAAGLYRADLSFAKLTDAWLAGAKLTDASLIGADLTNAVLSGADLTQADLTEADLTGAFRPPDQAVPEGWHVPTTPRERTTVSTWAACGAYIDWDVAGFGASAASCRP
jgi:Pentapeptide repeats (8 copies)